MKRVKFGDIVREVKIQVDRNNNPYPHYVAGDHMDSMDLTIRRKGCFATDDVGPAFIRIFKPGQVLYGSRRTYLKKIAVADFEGICSNTTFVLETKDSNVFLQELLPFVMLSDSFTKWSISHSKGSTNPYVLFSDLANYEFTLPSLDEQKVLADKLWAAYRVKESYKKLLAATDDMLKAKFQEMFGEDEKNKVPLHTVCETLIDGDWIESKDQSDSGVRLIQTGNIGVGEFKNKEDKSRFISQDTFDRLNCTEIFPGDILISRLPDPIGRACILPKNLGKSITAVDCTIIRLNDKMLPEFFIANTLSNYYNQQILSGIKGTTRLRISRRDLSLINILCPPLPLQQEFVAIATQAEATKESLRKSIENIDQVIKSLINQ
jgi:type I restriction enzyme S subunit